MDTVMMWILLASRFTSQALVVTIRNLRHLIARSSNRSFTHG